MSAPMHTPGPWSVWTSNSYRRLVSDSAGRAVIEPTVQRSDGHPDLHFPNGGANGPDANLIAAAPELLAALIAIAEFIPTTSTSEGGAAKYSQNVVAADMVRAAIAKATGVAK